jgi:CRISPR-associated endonuclease Csn1
MDPFNPKNRGDVSKALFRVRKLSSGNYWFMHHLETEILEDTESKKAGRCKYASISSLQGAIKVKLDRLGNIRPI